MTTCMGIGGLLSQVALLRQTLGDRAEGGRREVAQVGGNRSNMDRSKTVKQQCLCLWESMPCMKFDRIIYNCKAML